MDCSTDPSAPHGFVRNASHGAGEYVCECAGWEPPPIDMVLNCPRCGEQHIDAPEPDVTISIGGPHRETETHVLQASRWTNPPHRSHLCHECGWVWRPADVPTNGVAAILTKGKFDGQQAPNPA